MNPMRPTIITEITDNSLFQYAIEIKLFLKFFKTNLLVLCNIMYF